MDYELREIHLMNLSDWSNDAPTEPGRYWFYGEPFFGQMGRDFENNSILNPKLYYVEVQRLSNGLIGVVSGQFCPLKKFDKSKRNAGYVGYWKKSDNIELPTDNLNLFTTGVNNVTV